VDVRLCDRCCCGKAIGVTCCECIFVALVNQHANACAMLFCHLCPAWLYHIYPHHFINGTIFGKKLLNIKCAFIFPTFGRNVSHSTNNSATHYHNCTPAFTQSSRYSSQISIKLEYFQTDFLDSQMSNFIKIRPVGAQLFHAEGQTDTTNRSAAFRNFANCHKYRATKGHLFLLM
jgi:hypothetical protein